MSAQRLDPKTREEIVDRVSRELRLALGEVVAPTPPAPPPETPASLPPAIAALRRAGSQPEALRTLLDASAALGARAALFVARGDCLEGWQGVGFDDDPALAAGFAGVRLSRDQDALTTMFLEQRPIHAEVGGAHTIPNFGQTVRGEALLAPLIVHGAIPGVVYADPAGAGAPFDRHGVAALVELTGLAIERLVLTRAVGRPARTEPAPQSEQGPVRPSPVMASGDAPTTEPLAESWPELHSGPASAASGSAAVPAGAAEDARRYARLLMEEILLYHGDKVEQGRAQRDLLVRLDDELQQARELYDRRVDAHVRESGQYFEEALVRVLAAGDARRLGAAQGQPV